MSRRLVAYGSDDESPDRRKSREESAVVKKESDEDYMSDEEQRMKMRKIRKNSERWTASSGEENAEDEESESSSSQRSRSGSRHRSTPPRKRSAPSGPDKSQYLHLKPPKLRPIGSDALFAGRLPVTQSQSSLVSYGAMEDDEEDQFAKADKRARELTLEKREREDRSRSSTVVREPKPPRGHEESKSPDEIAVDNVLEEGVRELAQGYSRGAEVSAAESTPQSFDGTESPMPAEMEEELTLPRTPPAKCSPELEERFRMYFNKKAAGADLNLMMQSRRDFKNPSAYEVLIEKFHVDEIASNFNERVFDPHGFTEDCYYDAISAMQKELMEKHNAAVEKKAAAATALKSDASKANDARRKTRFEGSKKH